MKERVLKDKSITFALWISIFLCTTFFIFEPIKSYYANHEEYWFTLTRALKLYSMCWLITIIACMMMYLLISHFNNYFANILYVILFFFSLGLYIQGNFIPNTNGVLNGHTIDWSTVNIDMVCSDILWCILIVICLVVLLSSNCRNRIINIATVICRCFLLLELVVCIFLYIKIPNVNDKYEYTITDIQEFDVSDKENFIIFVLDAFDSSYLIGQENDDRVKGLFENFTFYSNAMSMYGHTDLSLPQMISGIEYKNETSYESYLINAYNNSPLLNRLHDESWDMGIYIEGHIPKCEMTENICNAKDVDSDFSSRRHFLTTEYRLIAYSVAPYHLKQLFWFYPDFVDLKDSRSDEYDLYSYHNGDFYDDMDTINQNNDNKVFRFYHIRGMHLPMHTTKDVEEQYDHVSMKECREANYKIIEKYLNILKEQGVYDDSIIMVMADHGESSDETGEWKQNPMLMVKGKNEHHEYKESDISISYADLQTIYQNLMDGKTGLEVFDGVDTSLDQSRLFYRYFYSHETLGSEKFPELTEYVSTDHASSIGGFKATGNVYSESKQ